MSSKSSPESSHAQERRRRKRLRGPTPGWLIPETGDSSDPWEVRVSDISRHGVGFESSEQMNQGEVCRIRIGRGPIELSRKIRVVCCHPGQAGTYRIGGEFV